MLTRTTPIFNLFPANAGDSQQQDARHQKTRDSMTEECVSSNQIKQ